MTRSSIIRAVDLFCGAGGTTQGAEQSGAARVICAVNHWKIAVDTHSANFPHTKHINSRIDQVNPGECSDFDLLFASPECTHHSNARGGRPTSDQQRAGAWDLMRWIEYHRPRFICVENVVEFRNWGPVDPKTGKPIKKYRGQYFYAWLKAVESGGYRSEVVELNAADFGEHTSRNRLFVLFRKGNRSVPVPEPTHSRSAGGELPGMELHRWRPAAEIVDWSIPCRSVFLRKHPLKDNTLFRIEAGLRKFVEPFVVTLRRNMGAQPADDPLGTISTSGAHHGLAMPFGMMLTHGGRLQQLGQPLPTITTATRGEQAVAIPYIFSSLGGGAPRGVDQPTPTQTANGGIHLAIPFIKPNFNEREGQRPRSHDVTDPLPTVTSRGAGDLIVPYLVQMNSGDSRRTQSINEPLKTVIAGATRHAIAIPIVITYYSNGKPHPITDPLCTISTRERSGLAMAIIETAGAINPRTEGERRLFATMVELGVADVGFRMFANHELALAQGFPRSYIFCGKKEDVTTQIGNAVCPGVAEALTHSFAGAA